jgi:CHASE2 domain-containing sensor protein
MGLNDWLAEYLWITYILIFLFITYVYNKVFRVRKLPILKEIVVYIIIALGSLMLLVFQVDARLPILQSLFVAIAMMITYRLRVAYLAKKNADTDK